MTVKHQRFLVEYIDDPANPVTPREVEVRVIMADRLNVELRGRKFGLLDPREQPQLTGFLWLYFAMIRQGDIPEATTFAEFSERCLDNEEVKPAETVPPTRESGGSASDSPSASLSSIGWPPSNEATTD